MNPNPAEGAAGRVWRRLSDDTGRSISLAAPPQRVVSLVPSLTELVCSLGGASRLVGVTRYCTEPASVVAGLPKVGGTKTPSLQQVVELHPDLVLMNEEENKREDFQVLTKAGLTIFVSYPRTVDAAASGIERLGNALDADAEAGAMAAQIRSAAAAIPQRAVRVFCPIWRKPWMSFNRDTFAHDLLRCAGAANLCADRSDRYPVVELQDISQADPEVILLPDEPYPFAERHRAALEPLAQTSAWRAGHVFFTDGKALSWYGPRTAAALRDLRALLARI
jgi:ABC-type Fe3+-hydroxamate transport system substrate-binding protein